MVDRSVLLHAHRAGHGMGGPRAVDHLRRHRRPRISHDHTDLSLRRGPPVVPPERTTKLPRPFDRVVLADAALAEDLRIPAATAQGNAKELGSAPGADVREQEQVVAGGACLRHLDECLANLETTSGGEVGVVNPHGGDILPQVAGSYRPSLVVELLQRLEGHDEHRHRGVVARLVVPVAVVVALDPLGGDEGFRDGHLRQPTLPRRLRLAVQLKDTTDRADGFVHERRSSAISERRGASKRVPTPRSGSAGAEILPRRSVPLAFTGSSHSEDPRARRARTTPRAPTATRVAPQTPNPTREPTADGSVPSTTEMPAAVQMIPAAPNAVAISTRSAPASTAVARKSATPPITTASPRWAPTRTPARRSSTPRAANAHHHAGVSSRSMNVEGRYAEGGKTRPSTTRNGRAGSSRGVRLIRSQGCVRRYAWSCLSIRPSTVRASRFWRKPGSPRTVMSPSVATSVPPGASEYRFATQLPFTIGPSGASRTSQRRVSGGWEEIFQVLGRTLPRKSIPRATTTSSGASLTTCWLTTSGWICEITSAWVWRLRKLQSFARGTGITPWSAYRAIPRGGTRP